MREANEETKGDGASGSEAECTKYEVQIKSETESDVSSLMFPLACEDDAFFSAARPARCTRVQRLKGATRFLRQDEGPPLLPVAPVGDYSRL